MAACEPDRKRKLPEAAGSDGEEAAAAAAADEEDEEERWVGPLPGEAAQAKKRRGNEREEPALACRFLLGGAAADVFAAPPRSGPVRSGACLIAPGSPWGAGLAGSAAAALALGWCRLVARPLLGWGWRADGRCKLGA